MIVRCLKIFWLNFLSHRVCLKLWSTFSTEESRQPELWLEGSLPSGSDGAANG